LVLIKHYTEPDSLRVVDWCRLSLMCL